MTAKTILVACDPGLRGGIAAMFCEAGARPRLLRAERMPLMREKNGKDVVDARRLREIVEGWDPDLCVIERVSSMPRQGVASTFKFGLSTGIARGLLSSMPGVDFEDVTPSVWKRELGLTSDKHASVGMARQLFPGVLGSAILADEGACEAALIAHWRARQWQVS